MSEKSGGSHTDDRDPFRGEGLRSDHAENEIHSRRGRRGATIGSGIVRKRGRTIAFAPPIRKGAMNETEIMIGELVRDCTLVIPKAKSYMRERVRNVMDAYAIENIEQERKRIFGILSRMYPEHEAELKKVILGNRK